MKIYLKEKNIRVINLIAVKIKSIKKLGKKENVYDIIGVPKNHNFIANHIVTHNCDLYARGVGAVFVKDKNPVMDTWRIKDFKNVGSYTEFTSPNIIREKLKKHPNFWQIIKFPKPPKWLYNKYLTVREKNVYDDDNVLANVSKEDIHRALLIMALKDIMENDVNLTMNRIILHISNEFDMKLTKGQVQALINDSKQLVTKIRETAQH